MLIKTDFGEFTSYKEFIKILKTRNESTCTVTLTWHNNDSYTIEMSCSNWEKLSFYGV